ncbi:MAG TPA: hypothetical protein DD727_08895 [Clostridiales bacterium]|nr:hypothetical protein [Clostridiales bacterium]
MTHRLFHSRLEKEMKAAEEILLKEFDKPAAVADHVVARLFHSGGKRLRPALLLACALAGRFPGEKALLSAAAIEMMHTATLVHDDIVDQAEMRRGERTLSNSFGLHTAVYAGDYLFVKSLACLARAGLKTSHLDDVARGIQAVCLGEMDQYFGRGSIPGVRQYLKRILGKTAALFAASSALGATLGRFPEKQVRAFGRFGGYLGMGFQIRDDLLDLTSDPRSMGKPVFCDLRQGVVTLPFILAARADTSGDFARQLQQYLNAAPTDRADPSEDAAPTDRAGPSEEAAPTGRIPEIPLLLEQVHALGGAKQAQDLMERYKHKALGVLDSLPVKPAARTLLEDLADRILPVS